MARRSTKQRWQLRADRTLRTHTVADLVQWRPTNRGDEELG